MSYRTFKHLLGETSLERKCRFIFGGGIFALVILSFSWYGLKTENLVIAQKTGEARVYVDSTILLNLHLKPIVDDKMLNSYLAEMSNDRSPMNKTPGYESLVIDPKFPNRALPRPLDNFEAMALSRFLRASSHKPPQAELGEGRKPLTFPDGTPTWMARTMPGRKDYQYVEAVLFQPRCLNQCHDGLRVVGFKADGTEIWAVPKLNDLAIVASVKRPMGQTNKEINQNRAILISTALVTAIIAMSASYVIVRYVIVKPVKHLRDVSDAIACGRLNVRSQIQTGDEFEDLSHAFNRMLHNLVAMQQELRDVNGDLDRKVDELAQANLALFEMNRLKSDFLATMSHELRTPLNSIIGFSEVLSSSDALTDKQRRYATNIQSSGKMLLGMINDILDLAKIESGKMEVRVEDFSIRDVCEGLANLARPIADRKNIDLECRLDEAIPLLRQDPGKVRQIIYNLLSNAIKFTPEGGRVTLRARGEGRNVVIEVADSGIGIAEEDRDRIFEKFRQAGTPGSNESVLTREHQGTGLGLSIVRELAKLLGGDVSLESHLGQGSTFTIRLPMHMQGSRKFEVNLTDERIDLSKARRVEPRVSSAPHSPIPSPDSPLGRRSPTEPVGGSESRG
jgi:signal transduction histidine kinase